MPWATAIVSWVRRLLTGARDAHADEVRAGLGEGERIAAETAKNAEDARALVPARGVPRPPAPPPADPPPPTAPPSSASPAADPRAESTPPRPSASAQPLVDVATAPRDHQREPNGAGQPIPVPIARRPS